MQPFLSKLICMLYLLVMLCIPIIVNIDSTAVNTILNHLSRSSRLAVVKQQSKYSLISFPKLNGYFE